MKKKKNKPKVKRIDLIEVYLAMQKYLQSALDVYLIEEMD